MVEYNLRCYNLLANNLSNNKEKMVDTIVETNVTNTVLVGSVLPYIIRSAIKVVGITVIALVFNAVNVNILLLASSLLLFSSCKLFMAFNPNGVAALPNPNIFAIMLLDINPNAWWFLGISGKRGCNIFDKTLDNLNNNPLSVAIFIMPSHKAITGNSLINISSESVALFNIVSLIEILLPLIILNIIPIARK